MEQKIDFVADEYCPATHDVHVMAPCDEKVPTEQPAQALAPVPEKK